ncbi:glycosyltransferase [Draconibacterium mangrovi]|uniref:glycosyltransferase n=1 Tax=Draconibacterium mangrovi TaxID=2697469 RepID=UPI0013D89361|nr:glycosyltransferase [Draconibacterium mangrovi]
MLTKLPKVSVVMPVYNREKYVRDSILSILTQSFTDFEFIIIDDGSTDSTVEILKSYHDKRIRLVKKCENRGNYTARNEGMEMAVGKYICVMDSDDVALPNRIQKQFDFMEANTKFGLCGSFAQVLNSDEIITAPEDYDEIKVWSMSNIMFRHPTVFLRKEFLTKYNLKYDNSYRYAGDYDFLVKAALMFPVTNIQEVLLQYRRHPEQISSAHKSGQFEVVGKVILKQLKLLKEDVTQNEKRVHLALMNRFQVKDMAEFEQLKNWANHLMESNYDKCIYDSLQLANFLKSLLKYILKEYQIAQSNRSKQQVYISKINDQLQTKIALPFHKPWAVLPDFIYNLLELIKENKPATIVECGSGLSTLVGGYLAKNKIIKQFISVEHDKQFHEATLADLKEHGLEKYVTLVHTPLKSVYIDGEEWLWYDTDIIETKINEIDILLVDGPPGQLQKNSRYPAIPLLKKYFNNSTRIILDDSNRSDEQEIINKWLVESPNLKLNQLETTKGMAVLNSG